MNIIQQFEQEQISKCTLTIPSFKPGDTLRVNVRVKEGTIERIQVYEGVVIAKRNKGFSSSFTVRKISHGEGVERRFMSYSPSIHSLQLVKRGVVRRAKLYYLKNLRGKAARIKERLN